MQLTQTQLEQYERDGFLILPGLFSPGEVAAMRQDLARIQGIDTDHLVRERSGGVAKTIFRVHEADGPTASPVFHAAARRACCSPHGRCSAMTRSTSTTPSAT